MLTPNPNYFNLTICIQGKEQNHNKSTLYDTAEILRYVKYLLQNNNGKCISTNM